MGASSSAINPTQDFLARVGGRLFEVGASAVKYGKYIIIYRLQAFVSSMWYGAPNVPKMLQIEIFIHVFPIYKLNSIFIYVVQYLSKCGSYIYIYIDRIIYILM